MKKRTREKKSGRRKFCEFLPRSGHSSEMVEEAGKRVEEERMRALSASGAKWKFFALLLMIAAASPAFLYSASSDYAAAFLLLLAPGGCIAALLALSSEAAAKTAVFASLLLIQFQLAKGLFTEGFFLLLSLNLLVLALLARPSF